MFLFYFKVQMVSKNNTREHTKLWHKLESILNTKCLHNWIKYIISVIIIVIILITFFNKEKVINTYYIIRNNM